MIQAVTAEIKMEVPVQENEEKNEPISVDVESSKEPVNEISNQHLEVKNEVNDKNEVLAEASIDQNQPNVVNEVQTVLISENVEEGSKPIEN
jgi:hypothetical protein